MVERQAEEEKEQVKELDTDRCPMDHPLSDYQNALQSVGALLREFIFQIYNFRLRTSKFVRVQWINRFKSTKS